MTLPWLNENVKQFIPLVKEQRIPHAILLSAAKGMGKVELAKEMAHLAMCENVGDNGVCYQCGACELLKAGNHTDLTVIKAENTVIKVSQIRQLTSDVVLTSSKNQFKVIIIEEAEKMNLSSANALLKTLEEPPAKVLIILTTHEMGRLLPTIRSRCVKITIQPTSQQLAQQWLTSQLDCKADDIDLALFLSDNSPLQAFSILQNNTIAEVRAMVKDMNDLQKKKVTLLEISKKWCNNDWYFNLNYIAVILLNYLAQKNGLQNKNNTELGFNITVDESGLLLFIRNIHQFSKRLELPLKIELQLEKLLLLWKKASSGINQ